MTGIEPRRLRIGIAGPFDLVEARPLIVGQAPVSRGYSTRVTVALADELLDRGHHVTVFTESTDPHDVGVFGGPDFELVVTPMRRRRRWIDFFRSERRALKSAIENSGCDVVHAHWTYEFALAALAAKTAPVLVTICDWGPEVLRHHRHPYRVVRLLMQARVLLRSPNLTANSPYIADKVRRWYRRRVPVVPNGIQLPDALPDRPATPGLVIGSVNNGFGELKNVQRLVEALPLIRKARPDARLKLVGADFEPGGPAERYARSRGLEEGIEFVGPIPAGQVESFMRSIDVLVHPSLEESFGMTLLEAIVEGTLVVGGAKSGAVPWVLGQGRAGTLVDVTEPASISEAVLSLPVEQVAKARLREEAFEHVRENFSLCSAVDSYERIYRQMLDG